MNDLGNYKNNAGCGQQGFTLMEVLIAITLSAVIMIALWGMFDVIVDTSQSIKDQERSSYLPRIMQGVIFEDLQSLITGKGSEFKFTGSISTFSGNGLVLMEFCTSATLGGSTKVTEYSLQRVEYVLRGDPDNRQLVRRERSFCGLFGAWNWSEATLLQGFSRVEFEYLNATDNTFAEEWMAGSGYPKAVRVRTEYPDGSGTVFVVELSPMAREAE